MFTIALAGRAGAAPTAPPVCAPVYSRFLVGDRFAILDGRAFHRALCDPDRPLLQLVLRGTSLDLPLPASDERGYHVDTIYGTVPGVGPTTVAEVTKAVGRYELGDDPEAAAFLINYLFAVDRAGMIAAHRGAFSTAQMVAAAQYLGYLAELRHDESKTRSFHRPIRTPTEVADAAEAALKGDDRDLLAGDCADVANAQGDLLTKLGARDVVLVTASLVAGLHTTVLLRDPGKQSYYHLNQGLAWHAIGREGSDLLQAPLADPSWANVGSGVFLNRPSGPTIAWVPTHAGKLYAEAAAMDVRALEPFARASSSLLGARLDLPWRASLQTFVARDASGAYYSGIGYRQAWAQARHFPGALGFVAAARRIGTGLSVADLYLHIEQGAVTPSWRVRDWLRAALYGKLILIGSYAVPFHRTYDDAWGFGAAVLLDAGTQVMLGPPGALLSGALRGEVQLAPGVANIAGSTPTVFVNHGLVAGDARLVLPRGVALAVSGQAVFDEFGTRLAAAVSVESARVGVRLEAFGRAVEDGPAYKEGSLRRGRLSGGVGVARWLAVTAMGEVQEATDDPRWIASGALEGRFP